MPAWDSPEDGAKVVVWRADTIRIWFQKKKALTTLTRQNAPLWLLDAALMSVPKLSIAQLQDERARGKVQLEIQEPADKAFPKKADVDANYDLLTKLMMDTALAAASPKESKDGCFPPIPAIATHDEKRVEFATSYAAKIGLPKGAYEFQMLYGIRRDLQEKLVKEGHEVRVYVPYGTHWYPYFMRRLAERPANIWFFVSNYFRG